MKNLDGQKLQLCTDKRVMEARNVHSLNSLNEYIKLLSMWHKYVIQSTIPYNTMKY